jgi:hypothetical protein
MSNGVTDLKHHPTPGDELVALTPEQKIIFDQLPDDKGMAGPAFVYQLPKNWNPVSGKVELAFHGRIYSPVEVKMFIRPLPDDKKAADQFFDMVVTVPGHNRQFLTTPVCQVIPDAHTKIPYKTESDFPLSPKLQAFIASFALLSSARQCQSVVPFRREADGTPGLKVEDFLFVVPFDAVDRHNLLVMTPEFARTVLGFQYTAEHYIAGADEKKRQSITKEEFSGYPKQQYGFIAGMLPGTPGVNFTAKTTEYSDQKFAEQAASMATQYIVAHWIHPTPPAALVKKAAVLAPVAGGATVTEVVGQRLWRKMLLRFLSGRTTDLTKDFALKSMDTNNSTRMFAYEDTPMLAELEASRCNPRCAVMSIKDGSKPIFYAKEAHIEAVRRRFHIINVMDPQLMIHSIILCSDIRLTEDGFIACLVAYLGHYCSAAQGKALNRKYMSSVVQGILFDAPSWPPIGFRAFHDKVAGMMGGMLPKHTVAEREWCKALLSEGLQSMKASKRFTAGAATATAAVVAANSASAPMVVTPAASASASASGPVAMEVSQPPVNKPASKRKIIEDDSESESQSQSTQPQSQTPPVAEFKAPPPPMSAAAQKLAAMKAKAAAAASAVAPPAAKRQKTPAAEAAGAAAIKRAEEEAKAKAAAEVEAEAKAEAAKEAADKAAAAKALADATWAAVLADREAAAKAKADADAVDAVDKAMGGTDETSEQDPRDADAVMHQAKQLLSPSKPHVDVDVDLVDSPATTGSQVQGTYAQTQDHPDPEIAARLEAEAKATAAAEAQAKAAAAATVAAAVTAAAAPADADVKVVEGEAEAVVLMINKALTEKFNAMNKRFDGIAEHIVDLKHQIAAISRDNRASDRKDRHAFVKRQIAALQAELDMSD